VSRSATKRTVRVCIAVAIASDGDYVAYGLGGLSDKHQKAELANHSDSWIGYDGYERVRIRMVKVLLPVPPKKKARLA
jgi:hypothetical protein